MAGDGLTRAVSRLRQPRRGVVVLLATPAMRVCAPPEAPTLRPEAFEEAPLAERGQLSKVWGRLQQFVDEHGMCTMSTLVTPDVFNRRTVASCFGALLRLHKRRLVHLSQDHPYGPIVIEVNQQEEGTPPMARHPSP
ncbi:hypothetical protein HPB52_012773 [Rhipicephalus sanguineus]|uniref:Rad21/Rec8-like protein C-terminal eukaryotic domain-containing protein n=1 Tax=Rhipicephalus sanguineus TaxID=34632 RepID=A0A9D4PFD7_RHISA|nr:hypothetical protein HPB52_012773 [Rhipicephalus sanguineus]